MRHLPGTAEREALQHGEHELGHQLAQRVRRARRREDVAERAIDVGGGARVEAAHGAAQLGVGARGDGELEPRVEGAARDHLPQEVDGARGAGAAVGQAGHGGAKLALAAIEQVRDGGGDQARLGRIVVQLRAARHARAIGHVGGGGARVAEIDEAVERRVEQPRARGGAALFLRAARSDRHAQEASARLTNSQA
jgi:hypothetical protein